MTTTMTTALPSSTLPPARRRPRLMETVTAQPARPLQLLATASTTQPMRPRLLLAAAAAGQPSWQVPPQLLIPEAAVVPLMRPRLPRVDTTAKQQVQPQRLLAEATTGLPMLPRLLLAAVVTAQPARPQLPVAETPTKAMNKHPQDRREWSPGSVHRAPKIVLNHVRDTIMNLARNAGVGS